ncbi:hypothetical protein CRG98_038183 [Punica granatum]|uniref:Uncharacterized protein n=1 Tax=Punica granatum TaxID=22663 RepID=A0A2I0IBN5_PUNGR|nr:hypothetical protein CRG98_038183 [Punica granatum]
MGKASRWFRGLLGLKKSDSPSPPPKHPPPPHPHPHREKRRWSFVKSHRDRDSQSHRSNYRDRELEPPAQHHPDAVDPERHAIAVAAATAAVAEAAVAAAQAAAAVVRLTSSGRCSAPYGGGAGDREVWAALKIQSAFRGYLPTRVISSPLKLSLFHRRASVPWRDRNILCFFFFFFFFFLLVTLFNFNHSPRRRSSTFRVFRNVSRSLTPLPRKKYRSRSRTLQLSAADVSPRRLLLLWDLQNEHLTASYALALSLPSL